MCGILGVFGAAASKVSVEQSLQLLLNRGPDFNSVIRPSEELVLGASRLAMTDPHPRSNQPFGKYDDWLVFNGEIYNYKELRTHLIQEHKRKFVTNSDTEVLFEMLNIYGPAAVTKLQGMFAFVYFNANEKRILLARDNLGKKPLYYSQANNDFFFASTIESLRKLLPSKKIDTSGLLGYLALGYTVDPVTALAEIRSLVPGVCYAVEDDGLIQKVAEFDSLRGVAINSSMTVRSALNDAVEKRIMEHDEVAISLSGGLDSSIVASLAASTQRRVVGYSVFWGDSDKSRYNRDHDSARLIASNPGIEFVGVDFGDVKGNIENNLVKFIEVMDEPNSNPTGVSMVPLYQKIASDGFRLVLTGDGSDEIFGGYPRYSSRLLGNVRFRKGDRLFAYLSRRIPSIEKALLAVLNPWDEGLWSNFHWNFRPHELATLLNGDLSLTSMGIRKSIFESISNISPALTKERVHPLEIMMSRDRSIWLTNESNRKLDRISMAFSVEARSPFQDEVVALIALRLMRVSKYKALDKSILWSEFPEMLNAGVRQDKAGFISPVGHWLRSKPEIVEIAIGRLMESGYFDEKELLKRSRTQFSSNFNQIRQLWSLVVLGYWMKLKIDS